MATVKKIQEEKEVVQGSIKDLDKLAAEYNRGTMDDKKRVALRVKLVGLFLDGKSTKEEQDLMEAILQDERNFSKISSRDEYLLNKIESGRCENLCVVKTDDVPQVHHLNKDMECKFSFDRKYNDGKNKKDSVGRFHVYVPRVVPTRHQLSLATVERELRGHPIAESEYPAPKVLIHRLVLKKTEFEKWFSVQDDSILKAADVEPEYQF